MLQKKVEGELRLLAQSLRGAVTADAGPALLQAKAALEAIHARAASVNVYTLNSGRVAVMEKQWQLFKVVKEEEESKREKIMK